MTRFDHHPPCPCGCGELADECSGPSPNPLGSMRVTGRPKEEVARELNPLCSCGHHQTSHAIRANGSRGSCSVWQRGVGSCPCRAFESAEDAP